MGNRITWLYVETPLYFMKHQQVTNTIMSENTLVAIQTE